MYFSAVIHLKIFYWALTPSRSQPLVAICWTAVFDTFTNVSLLSHGVCLLAESYQWTGPLLLTQTNYLRHTKTNWNPKTSSHRFILWIVCVTWRNMHPHVSLKEIHERAPSPRLQQCDQCETCAVYTAHQRLKPTTAVGWSGRCGDVWGGGRREDPGHVWGRAKRSPEYSDIPISCPVSPGPKKSVRLCHGFNTQTHTHALTHTYCITTVLTEFI